MSNVICVLLPIRIFSEANQRGHWAKTASRKALHRKTARLMLSKHNRPAGVDNVTITLIRIAPRTLDSDNLQSGFKSVRDGIADWMGIDDGHKSLTWRYEQFVGKHSLKGQYMAEVIVAWRLHERSWA